MFPVLFDPSNNLAFTERLAEEERVRMEREAEEAAAEAERKEEEEKRAALIEQRRKEREESDKKAALQRQREDEAERRRAERNATKSQPQSSTPTPWRRSTPQGTTPSTPPRSESPAPAKYRPGAYTAARTQQQQAQPPERTSSPAPTRTEDTWKRRGPLKSEDPAPRQTWRSKAVEEQKAGEEPPNPPTQAEGEGFQTVEKKGVWRPKALRERS